MIKAHSRLAPNQWETSLQNNVISYWLGANLKSLIAIYITIDPTYDNVMFKSQNIGHSHFVYEDTESDLIHCYHIIL